MNDPPIMVRWVLQLRATRTGCRELSGALVASQVANSRRVARGGIGVEPRDSLGVLGLTRLMDIRLSGLCRWSSELLPTANLAAVLVV